MEDPPDGRLAVEVFGRALVQLRDQLAAFHGLSSASLTRMSWSFAVASGVRKL